MFSMYQITIAIHCIYDGIWIIQVSDKTNIANKSKCNESKGYLDSAPCNAVM